LKYLVLFVFGAFLMGSPLARSQALGVVQIPVHSRLTTAFADFVTARQGQGSSGDRLTTPVHEAISPGEISPENVV